LAESFLAAGHKHSRLVFVVAEECRGQYLEVAGCEYLYHPNPGITGMTKPLNYGADRVMEQADIMVAVGHDVVIRTKDWEQQVLAAHEKVLVSYPDDGLNGGNLATAAFLDARIVRALGYMAPPSIRHLYIDNWWMAVGRGLNSLAYLPGVYWEHIHPFAGKREMDETTGAVNTYARHMEDRDAFHRYLGTSFSDDMAKIREALA
jgi:hypothetical protein